MGTHHQRNGNQSEPWLPSTDMRIFGACTDKMDPVTSYVEVSNLSEATISSGQQGSCHGSTIGGSIDEKEANANLPIRVGISLLTLVMKRIIVKKSLVRPSIMLIVYFMWIPM